MNRRGFLKMMFAGAAAVVAAPLVAAAPAVPKPAAPPPPKNRTLKARWTVESADDLLHMHNLEAEAELTRALAQEIQDEIDREVLGDLRANCTLGCKGDNYLHSGYWYAPYVPLTQTPAVLDIETTEQLLGGEVTLYVTLA